MSTSKESRPAALTRSSRAAAGEILVPVQKRIVPLPDGSTTTEVSIDIHEMPIPERRYVADAAYVDLRGDTVRFMFAQRSLTADKLRSLVVVTAYPEPVRQLFERSTEFVANFRSFLQRNGMRAADLKAFSVEPEQTVALVSNMMSVTFSGREAEWDFFHLAPSSLRKLATRSEAAVDPIVRIDFSTTLLAGIFDALERLAPELPPEAK